MREARLLDGQLLWPIDGFYFLPVANDVAVSRRALNCHLLVGSRRRVERPESRGAARGMEKVRGRPV